MLAIKRSEAEPYLGAERKSREEFENRILAATPRLCHNLLARSGSHVSESLVESLAAKARAASAVSPSECLRISELVTVVADAVDTERAHALALWARAAALRAHGRCEEALEAFLAGSAKAELAGDPLLAARIPIGATETMAQLGRYDEAMALSESLEQRLNALGYAEDAAKVVANAGNVHFQREAFASALACWERALAFFESRGDRIRSARLQMNVANVLVCLHRLTESMQMYESARAILESAGMDLLVAGLDGDLGYLRFLAGQHHEALQAYARARHRFEALDLPKDLAQCDRETADVYLDLNLIPESREIYERVRPVFSEKQMVAESARSDFGLSKALFQQGRHAEAFAALRRAERAYNQEGNGIGVARTWLCQANFQYRQQHVAGWDDHSTDAMVTNTTTAALHVFEQHGLAFEAVQSRLLLAEIDVSQGVSSRSSLEILAREIEAGAFRSLKWRIEIAIARTASRLGKLSSARKHYRRAVDAVERTRLVLQGDEFQIAFLQDKVRLYEEFVGLLLDEGTVRATEEAFSVMEQAKSRTLLESMAGSSGMNNANSKECEILQSRMVNLRAQLNWEYMITENSSGGTDRIPVTGGVTPDSLRSLEKEYLQTRRQLGVLRAGDARRTDLGRTGLNAIQADLNPGEQIIAYSAIQDELFAYVIDRDNVQVLRGLASRREIEELIERLRFQWNKQEMAGPTSRRNAGRSDATHAILGTLFEQLFEPLQHLLSGEQLTVIPHSCLHSVPFHALYDGEGYLIDRWEIAYAPSCAIWQACRQREEPQSSKSLLLGASAADLIHTTDELAHLKGLLPEADVFEGDAAKVAAVPEVGTFRYIHIATHAIFRKDNPLFSALKLSDGWLFAHDLYRRRLECSLATLAACHTGSGVVASGDEVLGLVRGFLQAGARAVLVSLWAADDEATAALMQEFYPVLAAGAGRACALRAAQQAIRERWPHPYYWASFALIGAR